MKVSEAVASRKSIREFLKTPVKNSLIKDLLSKSARAAHGGHIQPCQIFGITNEIMTAFLKQQSAVTEPETPAYDIYPAGLKEPYRTSRYELGAQMYNLLSISREDKEARFMQVLKNFEFFGAPAAIFCFVDRQMGPPQWSDLGMFLQTFMLLGQEVGIDTCAQEAWSMKQESVSNFFKVDDETMLFCGMAIGYKDPDAIVNKLNSERRPVEQWATFL